MDFKKFCLILNNGVSCVHLVLPCFIATHDELGTGQWWASAINSSLYFRAVIFLKIKGLIVIETFYFNER
jgi:hypothetical protein